MADRLVRKTKRTPATKKMAGRPEAVPSPWTAVTVRADGTNAEIGVWGRTYRFAGAPLPTSIVTAGVEVLASPIRLVGVVDGKPIQWREGGAFLFSHDAEQATICGWGMDETLVADTVVRCEFDGMMRVDLAIVPTKRHATPRVEQLWLEMPLRPEFARLYHTWPGGWGNAANSGAVPAEGMSMPFRGFVWLGWEDGGFGWFAESDEHWKPQHENTAIEVVRRDGETILRVRLLDSPPERLPATFTFGFQATPVKRMPGDFHEWRICHGASYDMVKPATAPGAKTSMLDKAAKLGVKTLIYHEQWTPIQNYWWTDKPKQLEKLVAECHKRQIKLLLYFGYELSTIAPKWGPQSDEVLVKQPDGAFYGGYKRTPHQQAYVVCYRSRHQETFFQGIADAVKRYGFDGVYLDGTMNPHGCANEKHGCGYRAPDGSLRKTHPIFEVRRLMRRLYELAESVGGFVNVHQSGCCVAPVMSFIHSYLDGEHLQPQYDKDVQHLLESKPDALLNLLPIDAFRAEFMGRNHGVPCDFLVYEQPPHWTFDHALALTMLHNVRVYPDSTGSSLERMSKIWDAMTRFGVSAAQWHPYWSNEDLVTPQPKSVRVSLYHLASKGARSGRALLVVANLSARKANASVTLNLKELGLGKAKLAAHDALTGEQLSLEKDRLSLPVEAMRMRMVVVK